MNIPWLCVLTLCVLAGPAAAEKVVYVAPTGSDGSSGARAKPFGTLSRAREALRQIGSGVRRTVVVRGGTYEIGETFLLDRQDSGAEAAPVTWRAAPGEVVRLVGGRSLPASAFHQVTDDAVLQRIDPAARGHVVCADLRGAGFPTPLPFPTTYHGVPPGPEVFFNGRRLSLARWPNSGWATIAKVVDPGSDPRDGEKVRRPGVFEYSGDRPTRWRAEDGVWLQGYWRYDWYDEVIRVGSIDAAAHRITLAAPHVYSLQPGNPSPRRYRALNLLEEIDEPGEYYIDRQSSILYLWPPSDITTASIVVSSLDAPIVALKDASYVTLQGFVVEAGLGTGIEVRAGTRCRIDRCEVRNMRRTGIQIFGGTHHRVTSCDIHDTGAGGLTLEGGDRKTLTPAGHEAIDNHIRRFSEHQLTGSYAISFAGVGNRAAHNLIHDAPHQAIFIGGNDHIFEYNEVYRICTETDDCGALYKGRNPSCRGNVIRYNYWHDIGSRMGHGSAAIYFDDGDGGDLVFGNVFYRCGDPGKGSFGTVFSHGGHGIRAENNIFIECKRALGSAPWSDSRWRDALAGGQDCFFPDKLLKEVDITRPPYTTHYPELVGFMNPPPGAPRVSVALRNLLVRCEHTSGGNWQFDPGSNFVTDADPGFVDAAKQDFRLRRGAQVFRKLHGFRAIPFAKIGLLRPRGAPPR